MADLFEAIPNFSEGRRPEVVEEIRKAALASGSVRLLDLHSDPDHNRSVLTLVGPGEPLAEALFNAVRVATERIDLRTHRGAHPRIGATDVVPFVPLSGTEMDRAVAIAHAFGLRVARELSLPVYFYGRAALRAECQALEDVRRGGFEALRDLPETDPARRPDLGSVRVHPTAGAVVVGAREALIAFNVYLDTTDVSIARAVARAVRHSSGGLRFVKALGLSVPTRGQVQVSMNLTNFERSALPTVFNLIVAEASAYGVSVVESEIVGLAPVEALLQTARHALRLRTLSSDQVLELRLTEEPRS